MSKPLEKLASEVFADLALAVTMGPLSHLQLEMEPFSGCDAFKRPRFLVKIPMHLPAFSDYGAELFSIIVPWDLCDNRKSASVVEIAPLRYGGVLFESPYFAEEKGKGGVVHPMLRGDQVERFRYPMQMRAMHEWMIKFCVTRRPTKP